MALALTLQQTQMLALFGVAGLFAIPASILFDQIIRFLYEHRRDVWEAEDRPSGLLYSPPGARHWYAAVRDHGEIWVLRTPKWMRDEPYCLRKLRAIRWLYGVGTICGVAAWFVATI